MGSRMRTVVTMPPTQDVSSYAAKRFAAGALFCPDCRLRLEKPVLRCPSCGFTGENTLRLFSGAAPAMEPWKDQAQCWDESSRKKILGWVGRLQRRFPQIDWCLLSIKLPEEVRLRLFNFWFFNVSPVQNEEEREKRSWTVLLTYDVDHQRFVITPGYQVEPILADDDWEDLLTTLKTSWREGGILKGYRDFFAEAERKLVLASRRMNGIIKNKEGGES